MKPSGVEDLKAALRRSLWLLVVLPILGAAAMTAIKQVQDPQYRATAAVVLPQAELAATLAGIQPVYVEPDRRDEAERSLARSPGLYAQASRATNRRFGSGRFMRSVTDVEAVNTLVYFRATTTDRRDAIGIANSVAKAYPDWRAGIYGKTIDAAIKRIEALDLDASDAAIAEQLQRLNVLKTLNSGNTLLVEPADDAAQITPRLIRDAVLGAAIGLIIALLLAGIRELLDTRVRSEADVEEALGVPVLATIRTLPRRNRNRVVVADDRVADTYDLLAANLAQILEQHERPVYVAVTSAEPGEGKTTTSANLALALARRGQDVVLADFDLRKPGLAPLFSVAASAPGVADVLRGDASVSSILRPIAISSIGPRVPLAAGTSSRGSVRVAPPRKDGEGSLLFLPGGRPGSGGSGGDFARLPKLLDEFETVADFVIIDTPPALLTAGVAELAQSMTAVLIVVRQGEVPQRRLRALAGRSRTWRDKIVGAVLNGSAAEERYSSYYGRE